MKNGNSTASRKERERRFIDAFLALGENQTRAYMQAFECDHYGTAATAAYRLLKKPYIQEAIERGRARIRKKFTLSADRVGQEWARVGYFNPSQLLDSAGKAIPLNELSPDVAAALASIDITEVEVKGIGKNQVTVTRRVKARPFSKTTALANASKILRLYDKPPPPPPDPDASADEPNMLEAARRLAFTITMGAIEAAKKAGAVKKRPARAKKPQKQMVRV